MKVWDLHCDTLSVLRNAEKEGRVTFRNTACTLST